MATLTQAHHRKQYWQEIKTCDRLLYVKSRLFPGRDIRINPFQLYGVDATDYTDEALEVKGVVAQELTEALSRVISEGGSVVSGPMRSMLKNCIPALLDKENATIEDLYNFLQGYKNKYLLKHIEKLTHRPKLIEYFTEKQGFSSKQKRTTKKAIVNRLFELLNGQPFEHMTCGKSTFELEQAVNHKETILFDLGRGSFGPVEGATFGTVGKTYIIWYALLLDSQYTVGEANK